MEDKVVIQMAGWPGLSTRLSVTIKSRSLHSG